MSAVSSSSRGRAVINIRDKEGNVWYTGNKFRPEVAPPPQKPRRERASALKLNDVEREVLSLKEHTTSAFWRKFIESLANRKDKRFSIRDEDGFIVFRSRMQTNECDPKIAGDEPESMLHEIVKFARRNGVIEVASYSRKENVPQGSPVRETWEEVPLSIRDTMLARYVDYLAENGKIGLHDMRGFYEKLIDASKSGMLYVEMEGGMVSQAEVTDSSSAPDD